MTPGQVKKQIEEGVQNAIKYQFDGIKIDISQYSGHEAVAYETILALRQNTKISIEITIGV